MAFVVLLAILIAHTVPVLCVITASCSNMTYQVASDPTQQTGYNLCNATTETQSSLCQTAFFNGLDDFCLWGPSTPTSGYTLNDNQQESTVAWCTQAGHGTRLITAGTFFTMLYIKTPDYIEVFGFFDSSVHQTPLNYLGDDPRSVNISGQFDPRGVDGRGSPIGGLMFSNAFGTSPGTSGQYTQAVEWVSIIGWDLFWLRACDPNVPGSEQYCSRWDSDHMSWGDAVFQNHSTWAEAYTSCLGDSRVLGVVLTDDTAITYTGQVLPPSFTYPPIPTSSCTTYAHSDLFYGAATISPGDEVCVTSTSTSSSASIASIASTESASAGVSKAPVGAIVGSTVAALVAISLLAACIIIRKQRQARELLPGNYDLDVPKNRSALVTPEVTATSPQFPYSIPTHSSLAHNESLANGSSLSPNYDPHGPIAAYQPSATQGGLPNYATLSPTATLIGLSRTSREPSMRNSVVQHDDDLGQWAAENRNLIPQELEQKLRTACYSPSEDPSQIPAREWSEKYGIGLFELRRLQDIYAKQTIASSPKSKEVHASGQGGASWRPQS